MCGSYSIGMAYRFYAAGSIYTGLSPCTLLAKVSRIGIIFTRGFAFRGQGDRGPSVNTFRGINLEAISEEFDP